jgi:hypothetical protein
LGLFLLLFPVAPLAHADEAPKTKLEQMFSGSGQVILKSFKEIDDVEAAFDAKVTVTAVKLTNASSGTTSSGVRIDVEEGERHSHSSYIDADELPGLLKGIDYITGVDAEKLAFPDYEAHYQTKGDLDVVVFSSASGARAVIASGDIGRAQAFVSLDNLARFRKLVAEAQAALAASP